MSSSGSGEVVVEHDVGRAEAFGAAQRQQSGIARPRTDEIHFAEICWHDVSYGNCKSLCGESQVLKWRIARNVTVIQIVVR